MDLEFGLNLENNLVLLNMTIETLLIREKRFDKLKENF
jgi:hypothetical protein